MNIVGNIIIEDQITSIPPNFNIIGVKDFNIESHNNLPTLIIGWETVKSLNPGASILRKKIDNNLYWTFSPEEKRSVFENDLKKFIEKSYKDFVKPLKYKHLDPIIFKVNSGDEFLEKIKNIRGSFAYLYSDKVIYVYNDQSLFSIDLDQLEFIGFDREKILSELKKTLILQHDGVEKRFKNEIKYLDIRYIPYLMFKDAKENPTTSIVC